MKVLVTGAQGFLGKKVVEFLLEENFQVRALTRRKAPELNNPKVEIVTTNLIEAKNVLDAVKGCQAIINCAAKTGIWGSFDQYMQDNYFSVVNLLQAAIRHKVAIFIQTSSPSVIHSGKDIIAGKEQFLPYTKKESYPYSYSKMLAERLILSFNSPSLQTIALRPHLIWGPGDPHLFPKIIKLAKKNSLWLFKGGPYLIDCTYIDNAAQAHILALKSLIKNNSEASGKAYFISQGEPIDINIMIQKLLNTLPQGSDIYKIKGYLPKLFGRIAASSIEAIWHCFKITKEPPITKFVYEEMTTSHYFDLSQAKKHLKYEPKILFEDGFERLKKYNNQFFKNAL